MKQIIIIGAGSGISQAVAERFGKEGFRVDLIARDEAKLEVIRQKLEEKKIESCYIVADASKYQSLRNALDQLDQLFGTPDIVLYNASDPHPGDFNTLDWNDISKACDTTIGGAYHTIKIMLPYFEKSKKGTFFFTGGGFALEGDPEWLALSIGKSGLRSLVQALSKKLKHSPVRCSLLTVKGFVNSAGQKYTPEKISDIYWQLWSTSDDFQNEVIY